MAVAEEGPVSSVFGDGIKVDIRVDDGFLFFFSFCYDVAEFVGDE